MRIVDELVTRFRLEGISEAARNALRLKKSVDDATRSVQRLQSSGKAPQFDLSFITPKIAARGRGQTNEPSIDKAFQFMLANMGPFGNAIARVHGQLSGLGLTALSVFGAMALGLAGLVLAAAALIKMLIDVGVALTRLTVDIAKMSLQASAKFESLKMALRGVTGDAKVANEQFEKLFRVSMLPGVDFESTLRTSLGLQATGKASFEDTIRIVAAFGNAAALAGVGAAEFEMSMVQLRQSLAKGKIEAQDWRSIVMQIPQVATALTRRFGTQVTEDLNKMGITSAAAIMAVVEELEGLAKAEDTLANKMVNLKAVGEAAFARIGDAIAGKSKAALDAFANSLVALIQGGAFAEIGAQFGRIFHIFETTLGSIENMTVNIIAGFRTWLDVLNALVMISAVLLKNLSMIPGLRIAGAFAKTLDGAMGELSIGNLFRFYQIQTRAQMKAGQAELGDDLDTSSPWSDLMLGNEEARRQTPIMAAIERNTRDTVDLQKRILGGGAVGAAALNPVKVSQAISGGGGSRSARVRRLMDELISAVMAEAGGPQVSTWASVKR